MNRSERQQVNTHRDRACFRSLSFFAFLETTRPTSDVHKFIFDDETVVVDDCSFVLPYIEGAYYYPSTTSPPDTDLSPANLDPTTDAFAQPQVPAYTEPQLKELLRRQV